MTEPTLNITETDEATLPSSQESIETPETEPTAVAKLQQATQTTRDINNKLQHLEQSFTELASEAHSHEKSVNDAMQTLRERCQSLAGDISRVSVELANAVNQQEGRSAQQEEKTRQLSDTLEDGLQQLNFKLSETSNTLQTQHLRLTEAERTQAQFSETQDQIKLTAASQAEEINNLRAKILTHTVALKELRQENEQQFNIHSAAISELGETDQTQQTLLNRLRKDTDVLAETSQQHEQSLEQQATNLADHQHGTRNKFRWVAAGICALTLGVTGAFAYNHYQQEGQMTALTAAMTEQTQGGDTVNEAINRLEGNIVGIDSTTTEMAQRVENLKASLSQYQSENTALMDSQNLSTQQDIAALQATLSTLQNDLNNLESNLSKPASTSLLGLSEPVVTLNNAEWINAQDAGNYTIQLVGVYQYQSLVNYVNQHADDLNSQPLSYSISDLRSNDFHNLLYGNFTSFSDAQKTLQSLPANLQNNGPWVRTVGAVQKTMK